MQDGPFLTHRDQHDILRRRVQTRVALVVFWTLFILATILISLGIQQGWWVGGLALGWAACALAMSLIDAHYIIKGSR